MNEALARLPPFDHACATLILKPVLKSGLKSGAEDGSRVRERTVARIAKIAGAGAYHRAERLTGVPAAPRAGQATRPGRGRRPERVTAGADDWTASGSDQDALAGTVGSAAASRATTRASRVRPRDTRAFTVPTGTLQMLAASS
jgi:hypothetical protein